MARRAEWRTTDDPRTVVGRVGRGAWEVLSHDELSPWVQTPLALLILPLVFGVVLVPIDLVMWADVRFGLLLSLPTAASLIALILKGWWALTQRPDRPTRLGRRLTLPLPEGSFPVRVAIRYRGVMTGLDEAEAALGGGWLHVEGRRTSFSLRREDVRGEWRKDRLCLALEGGQILTLRVDHSEYWAARGRPRDAAGRPIECWNDDFARAAERWLNETEGSPGESILPPQRAHPIVRTCWTFSIVATWLILGVTPILVRCPGGPTSAVLSPLLFVVGVGLLGRIVVVAPRLGEANRADRSLRLESQSPSDPLCAFASLREPSTDR